MSKIFSQLSGRQGNNPNDPPMESPNAAPAPNTKAQLELGLPGVTPFEPVSPPLRTHRARQPAAAPAPADDSTLQDAQAKLTDARAALARNEEILASLRREQKLDEQLLAARRSGPRISAALFGRSKKTQIGIKSIAIAAVAMLTVGVGAFLLHRHHAKPSGDLHAVADGIPAVAPVPAAAPATIKLETGHPSISPDTETGAGHVSPAFAAANGASLPAIEMKGLQTKPVDRGFQIVFDKGMFSRRASLSDEARDLLKQLAGQLRPAISTCRLEITGHTDPEPVRGDVIPDNQTLGYQRARTVAEYLAKECSLPADALSTTSAGDANAPYPNTTPELRRKNRTVTIIVTPR